MNTNRETEQENIIMTAQANFLKIDSYIDHIKKEARKLGMWGMHIQNNGLLSLTINKLGFLTKDKDETEGIRAFKNSGFYFDSRSVENEIESITKFEFNRTAEYAIKLKKEFGENIFDKRFKGTYKYTKYVLRKKYDEEFWGWVNKKATLNLQKIEEATIQALKEIRQNDIDFNNEYNQKNNSLVYDCLIKSIPTITLSYVQNRNTNKNTNSNKTRR